MAKVGRMVKEASVAELSSRLFERPNFFVTSISRLQAADADSLRQKLFGAQGRLVLVKRRLGQRALQALNIAGLDTLVDGSVGVVLSGEDVLLTAKVLMEFHKGREEQLAVRGAVIDGQLLDPRRVKELADLPAKPILLVRVIGTVEAPIANVITTVERLIGDIIRGIDQLVIKRAAEAPAAPPAAVPPAEAALAAETAPDAPPSAHAPTSEAPGAAPASGL